MAFRVGSSTGRPLRHQHHVSIRATSHSSTGGSSVSSHPRGKSTLGTAPRIITCIRISSFIACTASPKVDVGPERQPTGPPAHQALLTGDRNPLNTYTAAQQPGTEAPAQTATASVQVKFLSSDRVSLGPATRTFLHTTSGPLNVAAAGPTWSQMQRQPRSRKIGSDKRQCTEPECNIRPSFNFEGIRKGLYCSFHRKDGMVNVTDLRCLENGCRVVPKFNAPGSSKGLYCGAHKLEGMVLLYSTLCENQGCKVTAAFNLPGERSRRFCATHRLEGMIDVQGKRCENPACERFPLFNVAGVRGGRFCSSHRLEGMVKRVTTKCEHLACTISPLFNQLGLQGGRFCSSHKLEGMVNVVTKRCEESGCVKCASHKCEGEKGKRFCTEHARVGMVGPNKKKVM